MNPGLHTIAGIFKGRPDLKMASQKRLRLWVVLFGLFCASGQQFLESTHAHTAEEAAAYCQLCSGFADTAIPSRATAPIASLEDNTYPAQHHFALVSRTTFAFRPRGPPTNA